MSFHSNGRFFFLQRADAHSAGDFRTRAVPRRERPGFPLSFRAAALGPALLAALALAAGPACRAAQKETSAAWGKAPASAAAAAGESAGPHAASTTAAAGESAGSHAASAAAAVGLFTPPGDAEGRRIAAALPDRPPAVPAKPRKILVFSKCEGYVHASIPTAKRALELMGAKTGAFETVFSEDMAAFDPGKLAPFDAVLFNNSTRLSFADPARRKALIEFVKSGKGLIGIHAALDSFYSWPEGAAMLGGLFDGHPWHAGGTWAVKIDEPEHPLGAPFKGKGFLIRDEIYQVKDPYSRARSRVLLSLDMTNGRNRQVKGIKRKDGDFAVSWIHPYGKGRVFYCSLGHNKEVYENPAVLRHYLAGIQYALGDLRAEDRPSAALEEKPAPARTTDPGGVEDPFAAAAAYRFGTSRAALADIEEWIRRAAPEERAKMEDRLIAILDDAGSTFEGKQFACRALRRIGTEKAVWALAGLLGDHRLSAPARFALQGLPSPAADDALRAALGRVHGDILVGVIGTIARRGDKKAVPLLSGLVAASDRVVAEAAIDALGVIGGDEAAAALEAAPVPAALQKARDNALLRCADSFLAAKRTREALALYRPLSAPEKPSLIRAAALRGILHSGRVDSLGMIARLFDEDDPLLVEAAGRFAVELPEGVDAAPLASRVASLPPPKAVILLTALAARGTKGAAPAAARAAGSDDIALRTAALKALGEIGGSDDIPLLAEAAARGGDAGNAAAAALGKIAAPGVDAAILATLEKEGGAVRAALLGALAGRRSPQALPACLAHARDPDPAVRREALRGLEALAAPKDIPDLLALLAEPASEDDRGEIEKAVLETCRRTGDPAKRAAPLLAALPGATGEMKASLTRLLGGLPSKDSLDALEGILATGGDDERPAALEALARWPDASPLETLLDLAPSIDDGGARRSVLEGIARMASLGKDSTGADTYRVFEKAMAAARTPEERNMLLERSAAFCGLWVPAFVKPWLEKPETREGARKALDKAASALARKVTENDARGCPVVLLEECSKKYNGKGKGAAILTDGEWGSTSYGDGRWLGFQGGDMTATIDLKKTIAVESIRAGFLLDNNSWIFLPESVEFSLSPDGENFTPVATVEKKNPRKIVPPRTDDFFIHVGGRSARYVRVRARSVKTCPAWHPGSGGDAWLFADEIQVNPRFPAMKAVK